MSTMDILLWLLVGLIAGTLAGITQTGITVSGRLAVLVAGVSAAYAGGWAAGSLVGTSAVAFLGAVCAAVPAAMCTGYALRRHGLTRYHVYSAGCDLPRRTGPHTRA
jgi:uncharacterized membrane protein YeaQ/YmgE (transglycosylase-associated protein family)